MKENIFKSLIIGCGKIAGTSAGFNKDTHAGAIILEPRLDLVTCVDSNIAKANMFAQKYCCHASETLENALSKNYFDLISVCTPDDTHFAIVKEILKSKSVPKVIFLEKPVCLKKDEFNELEILSVNKGVLIVVNHTRRFSEKFRAVRKLLSSETLGTVYRVNAIYYGGWLHNGSHLLDTIFYLFKDNIIWSSLGDVLPSYHRDDPTLEFTGFLEKSNAKVVISGIDESLYQIFDFDIWCKNGRILIENFGSKFSLYRKVMNSEGESVLELDCFKHPHQEISEMQTAFTMICNYLDSNDKTILEEYSLNSARKTMEGLWLGLELYKKENF